MLGLILIYFIGKQFFELAFEYKKPQWPYAILGVVTYYGSLLLFAFILGIILGITGNADVVESNKFLFGILCIPIGYLCAWILLKVLEKKWKKNVAQKVTTTELLDDL